MEYQIKDLQM